MKRLMSITLAVVLVLALGSWAFAVEGPLGQLETEIDVYANIGPYAKIETIQNIDFGTLVGKVGIYIVNGDFFYDEATVVFGTVAEKAFNDNSSGWGRFEIETNTDVTIGISFDNEYWLQSPTIFGVHPGGDPGDGWWSLEYSAWASSNWNLDDYASEFPHAYKVGAALYDVNGAIWIESISQQFAKEYNGTLVVTVSAAQQAQ